MSTYKPDQWNIYSEIRRKLVEDHNIPEKQIKFIQEANSDNARKELFKNMNSGRIRFLSVPHRNWERVSTRRNVPWPSIIWTYPEAVRSGAAQRTRGEKRQYHRQAVRRQQGGLLYLCGGEVTGQLQVQPAAKQAGVHQPAQKAAIWPPRTIDEGGD